MSIFWLLSALVPVEPTAEDNGRAAYTLRFARYRIASLKGVFDKFHTSAAASFKDQAGFPSQLSCTVTRGIRARSSGYQMSFMSPVNSVGKSKNLTVFKVIFIVKKASGVERN